MLGEVEQVLHELLINNLETMFTVVFYDRPEDGIVPFCTASIQHLVVSLYPKFSLIHQAVHTIIYRLIRLYIMVCIAVVYIGKSIHMILSNMSLSNQCLFCPYQKCSITI